LGSHLDQIEIKLLSTGERLCDAHDSKLFPSGTDHANFWDANTIVQPWFGSYGLPLPVYLCSINLPVNPGPRLPN
jgi:hypothetical protein